MTDQAKKVTAEERAKGLAYDIALCWCKQQHQSCEKAEEIIPLIAEALTLAAQEGHCCHCPSHEESYASGAGQMQERAAKLAEDFTEALVYPKKDIDKMQRDTNVRKRQREKIAEAIRTLKDPQ